MLRLLTLKPIEIKSPSKLRHFLILGKSRFSDIVNSANIIPRLMMLWLPFGAVDILTIKTKNILSQLLTFTKQFLNKLKFLYSLKKIINELFK